MTAFPTGDTDDWSIEHDVNDLSECWQRGERPLVETILLRRPEIRQRADAVLELLAEELALRDEFRYPTTVTDVIRRFPDFALLIPSLFDCQRLFGSMPGLVEFPTAPSGIGEFELIREVGRGANSRVYLSRQPSLADRLIILKLSPQAGYEHLSLARLQHSNIVPLYSSHEFHDWGLRGLCQPYFGGLTLTALLDWLESQPTRSNTLVGVHSAVQSDPDQPCHFAWSYLTQSTIEEAICHIGAGLSEALQYAHDRGMLHLDVKPSNVLIAADNVPMLLDFHLAHTPMQAGDSTKQAIGGTPGYMPPEQVNALEAVREGKPIPQAVDARADLFAIGITLRELYDRCLATDLTASFGRIGLMDILAKCTANQARDRYRTAAELAADFRRQLANMPLKGAGNRSLSERFVKWRRRRPLALPLAIAWAALAAVGIGLAFHASRLVDQAQESYREGVADLTRGQFEQADQAFLRASSLLNGIPLQSNLRLQIARARSDADLARTADDLHRFVDRIRPYFDVSLLTGDQRQLIARSCRDVWTRRVEISEKLTDNGRTLPYQPWRTDLLDLAAWLVMVECSNGPQSPSWKSGLDVLDQAEQILGTSRDLAVMRRKLQGENAHERASERDREQSDPQRDSFFRGRTFFVAGEYERAIGELDRCLIADPQSTWANYYRGLCCMRLNRPIEAVASFSACTALAPDAAWCAVNRGLAYAEANQLDAAVSDFTRAIRLDPGLSSAYLGRAAIYQRTGRFNEALDDLNLARKCGVAEADICYRSALVYRSAGKRLLAIQSVKQCLEVDPGHREAQILLAELSKPSGHSLQEV